MSHKYVYLFSEGNGFHARASRRQRREPCRNDRHRYACSAGLHRFPPRPAPSTMRTAARSTTRSMAEIYGSIAKMEEINGKKFGDHEEPAARFRAFRRPRFHARHDGHHPEPRPERRRRRRPDRREIRIQVRALCLRLLPPLHPDVLRRRHGSSAKKYFEEHHRRDEGRRRASSTTSSWTPTT